jgi:hypothetical protein
MSLEEIKNNIPAIKNAVGDDLKKQIDIELTRIDQVIADNQKKIDNYKSQLQTLNDQQQLWDRYLAGDQSVASKLMKFENGQFVQYTPTQNVATNTQAASSIGAQIKVATQAQAQAQGLIYNTLLSQASLWAFVENFRLFGLLCLGCIPLVFLFKKVHHGKGGPGAMH